MAGKPAEDNSFERQTAFWNGEGGLEPTKTEQSGEPPDNPWRMGNESRDTIFSRPDELDYRNQEALPISQEDMVTYSFKLSREHSDRRKRERDGREPAG